MVLKNKDKYLKDGVEQRYFATDLFKFIKNAVETCGKEEPNILSLINTFLSLPAKPTLTEDEKVILRNALESGADAIFRNDGGIYFHTKPGTKGIFGNIFQFIQPRRRI